MGREEDPVETLLLFVRGSGDGALAPIFRLADALNCRVLDIARDKLITETDTTGWHAFQAFRDITVRCLLGAGDPGVQRSER